MPPGAETTKDRTTSLDRAKDTAARLCQIGKEKGRNDLGLESGPGYEEGSAGQVEIELRGLKLYTRQKRG